MSEFCIVFDVATENNHKIWSEFIEYLEQLEKYKFPWSEVTQEILPSIGKIGKITSSKIGEVYIDIQTDKFDFLVTQLNKTLQNISDFFNKQYQVDSTCNILQVEYPPITSYPSHAMTLTAALSHKEAYSWFFNNYIQLYVRDHHNVDFFEIGDFEMFIPHLSYQCISRDIISNKWSSFTEFAIDSIDLGYYLHTLVNQYFIRASGAYKKRLYPHSLFIYGYNLEQKEFYIADFFNMKYSFQKASFLEVEKAYNYIDLYKNIDDIGGVKLFKYRDVKSDLTACVFHNNEDGYVFDIYTVINFINDYIHSQNSYKLYWISAKDYNAMSFGISVYGCLCDYLSKVVFNNKKLYIDHRPFHVLLDHKNIMILRIQYLADNGYLPDYIPVSKAYLDIKNKVTIVRNLVLKYNVTKNNVLLNRAANLLRSIKLEEELALRDLLKKIKYIEK
jgi:hypothetical protein